MKLITHQSTDYARALQLLLPPGQAWQWQKGSLGQTLLEGFGCEMARLEADTQTALDLAIERHRPKAASWHIREYRKIAKAFIEGVTERLPRRTFRVGSRVGERLWGVMIEWPSRKKAFAAGGHAGMRLWTSRQARFERDFPVKLLEVDHLIQPFGVACHAGQSLYGHRARYLLRVRYYQSVINPAPIFAALTAFKQAHVFLWFEDITGQGGFYAQN